MMVGEDTHTDRVQKIIAASGYCSRRKAEELIAEGRVRVNQKKMTLGDKAGWTDSITIDGKEITHPKKRYLKFYKPMGCLTTLSDPSNKKTLLPFLSRIKERVYPVGRLDYNTEGLLFLTNDGEFANHIMHPRYEHAKRYRVSLDKEITPDLEDALRSPIELEDGPVSVDSFSRLNPTTLDITIHIGRNRIIRRLFESLEYDVLHLKRMAIDTITLESLKPGEYQDLTNQEVHSLMKK